MPSTDEKGSDKQQLEDGSPPNSRTGIHSLTDSFNCWVTFVECLLGAGDTNTKRYGPSLQEAIPATQSLPGWGRQPGPSSGRQILSLDWKQ